MARLTVGLSLAAACAAQAQLGRGGPNMMQEFELENAGDNYPFQPFPSSYVKRALAEGADWTQDARGIVTSVKNQGRHGYCGTFGRVETAEGQYALHSGHPARNLSVEQLVDCVGWSNPQGPSILAEKGSKTPGLMSWEDYPYDISKYPDRNPPIPGHPCKFDTSKVVPGYTGISGQTSPLGQGDDQAAAFIHHNGPNSCGINAGVFKHADSDHFVTEAACKEFGKHGIDHSVLCVGFGVDPKKGPYWKIKNTWSDNFADHGFIKVARGVKCAGLGSSFGSMPVYGHISGYYVKSEEVVV